MNKFLEQLREIVNHNHNEMKKVNYDQNRATSLFTMEHNHTTVYDFFYDETLRDKVDPFSYYPYHHLRRFVINSIQEIKKIRFAKIEGQVENVPTTISYKDVVDLHPQRIEEWIDILLENKVENLEKSGHLLDQFTGYYANGMYMDITLYDGQEFPYCELVLRNSEGDSLNLRHIEAEDLENREFILEDEDNIQYWLYLSTDTPQVTLLTAFKAMMYVAQKEGVELEEKYEELDVQLLNYLELDLVDMIANIENVYSLIHKSPYLRD